MKCKYCGGSEFYEGPSGGMSVNVLCANEECRHWFNHTPFGLEDLRRIEPTEDEKTKKNQQITEYRDSHPNRCYDEGVAVFNSGDSAIKCISSKPSWHSCNGEDFFRLAGWMDALRGKIENPS